MSTNEKSAAAVRRGDLVTEVLDRLDAMALTREEFMDALGYLAGYDPDAVSAALDGVQFSRKQNPEAGS
ncbi:MAG TPA: hypothetical protein VFU47_15695 [Armatimonadota bacterium]|nr:hypothetical protein [Armatimonadota bacterium]